MLFCVMLASRQIVMRKVDGWETLAEPLSATPIDLARMIPQPSTLRRSPAAKFPPLHRQHPSDACVVTIARVY
jgi:hypothetical protein